MEIIGNDFFCNLVEVHLNVLAKKSEDYIKEVFYYAGLECSTLLSHEFDIEKFRYSREVDPIVGVSFTGLFDFFVYKFGKAWLDWWSEGRPHTSESQHFLDEEARLLSDWKEAARQGVTDYCNRIGTRVPSRYTTVQPAGTKSLLTGASPGWHPPKAPRFIRRITFAKDDPVAKACIDYGYSVVPAHKDTDEEGNLLNDPYDPRCTEWLVEIPVEVSWANLEGCDSVHTDQFSVAAQFDFFMQVQNHYTTHNTSATLEYRESEIDSFAQLLHSNIANYDGYMSAAMMARFDANQTFPRLPFEPISKDKYEQEVKAVEKRRKGDDFYFSLMQYDIKVEDFAGPSGCDGDKCLMPEKKPS